MLAQDLRYALRQLRRAPGFAIVAIASLAVGIGANVTIYSAAHAFLQRQPDAVRPNELVRVYRGGHSPLPREWFLHFERGTTALGALIAEDPMAAGLAAGETTERVYALVVSENYFSTLGVGPAMGTVFTGEPGEDVGQVAVLSHRYWRARLGADSGIVGRSVRLNDQLVTVIGIAREGFASSQFGWAPDVYVPLSDQARLRGVPPDAVDGMSFYITGRLVEGRSPEQAQAELLALARTLPGAPREALEPGAFRVESARGITAEVRGPATMASMFLLLVTGVVLLIACANLANLLLARATARRKEIAIRTALGVGRSRLVRQLLTESAVVATLGGIAGFGVAAYITRLLPTLLPPVPELAFNIAPDVNVVVFAALIALLTSMLFGLAPALHATRIDVQQLLRSEGAGSGSRRSRLRSTFLVAQVALATVLLVTSALFVRSLGVAQNIDPGFSAERIVDLPVDLSLRQYEEGRGRVWFDGLLQRVREVSSVETATLIGFVPLSGSNSGTSVALASADPGDRSAFRGTTFTTVAPGYFEMMEIPILQGRGFDATDRESAPAVVVVNESFARMHFPDENPVGQSIRFFGGNVATVVGVTPDTKYQSLSDNNEPFLYRPTTQDYRQSMVLQVKLTQDTPANRAVLRSTVQALDPALPLPMVTSMEDDMQFALLPSRAGAMLLGLLGTLALFLATIGMYGVTAFLVGQRTAEIGIRAALGASRNNVLGVMMRETLVLVLVGLALGLAGGIGLGAVASGWLYGVGALDPLALGSALAVLLTVALIGTWLPARRALKVDPMRALRSE